MRPKKVANLCSTVFRIRRTRGIVSRGESRLGGSFNSVHVRTCPQKCLDDFERGPRSSVTEGSLSFTISAFDVRAIGKTERNQFQIVIANGPLEQSLVLLLRAGVRMKTNRQCGLDKLRERIAQNVEQRAIVAFVRMEGGTLANDACQCRGVLLLGSIHELNVIFSDSHAELQSRINRFTFQRQDSEYTLVNAPERFLANEAFEGFDPEGKLAKGEGSLCAESA